MRLVTFAVDTPVGEMHRVGVDTPAGIVDATAARIALLERSLPAATAARVGAAQVPPDMIAVLGSGKAGLGWIREAVDAIAGAGRERNHLGQRLLHGAGDVRLLAPVPRPPGLTNFNAWPEHIKHSNSTIPTLNLGVPDAARGPQSYWKGNPCSFVGPDTVLEPPPYAKELDVECELVAIIGTGGRNLSVEEAESAIAGYSILNDVSAREQQFKEMKDGRGPSKGKDFDGGNVLGPCIVTADEIGDPRKLEFSLHLNGERLSGQDGSGMAFSFAQMVSYLSLGQTLYPGHVVTGGSYYGGCGLDLKRSFKPGDVIELKISKIGTLRSTMGGAR